MLKDCRPVAFLATTKPDEAKAFFGEALGLPLVDDNPYFLIFQAGPIQLRLQKVDALTPPRGTAFGWGVPDIAAEMKTLLANGVTFERFEGMVQDEAGVWIPPGSTGKVCWFKDPDGNLLSLSQ